MQSNIEKLQIKAAFLLSALCSESNAVRGEIFFWIFCIRSKLIKLSLYLEHVLERKLIEHLGELLSKKDQPYEHLLAALLSLVRDHPQAQEECKRPELYYYNILIKLREHSIIHENLVRKLTPVTLFYINNRGFCFRIKGCTVKNCWHCSSTKPFTVRQIGSTKRLFWLEIFHFLASFELIR